MAARLLAVITGASTGIGFELARIAAEGGCDLVVAANEPIDLAAFAGAGTVALVDADLSTLAGIDAVAAAIGGRPVDYLCANAGIALGHAFLDQPMSGWRHVVDTNVIGSLLLLHRLLPAMVDRSSGRVLVTGSINGSIPGPYLAGYNSTKAFLNSFTDALRNELKDSPVTLTTLMPGPVETPIYARADMLDTFVGATRKPAAAGVAPPGGTRCWSARRMSFPACSTSWSRRRRTSYRLA